MYNVYVGNEYVPKKDTKMMTVSSTEEECKLGIEGEYSEDVLRN